MNINLHIERLILDGLPVNGSDSSIVQAAVEGELMRLLAEQGLTGVSARAVPNLSLGPIELGKETKPAHLGHQIARTIHEGFRPSSATPHQQTATGEPSA
jgi:hypothetical protein